VQIGDRSIHVPGLLQPDDADQRRHDYLYRSSNRSSTRRGVKNAEILGARLFALRAWLDSDRMAAHGVTAADVSNALSANNYLAALGKQQGQVVSRRPARRDRSAHGR